MDTFAIAHGILLFHCEDPDGFLFYNNLDSFDGADTINYKSAKLVNSDDSKTQCAHIKFYRDSADSCHAEVRQCMLF
jgi:hypothetical protein